MKIRLLWSHFVRDLSFRSFDHEYGFEIESILEEILRA